MWQDLMETSYTKFHEKRGVVIRLLTNTVRLRIRYLHYPLCMVIS